MSMSAKVSKLRIGKAPSFNTLKPVLRKKMYDILAEHSKNYQGSRAPDGSSQKQNSPGYAAKKNNPGIKVGSQYRRGNKPLYLTGDMLGSRQVRTTNNSIEATFEGSSFGTTNTQKAAFLVEKGYKLHYFSDKQIEEVQNLAADEMIKQMVKNIEVK